MLAGAVAWYSHLLLDTLYNHGKGLAIFWPFGSGRVALPIPWFSTLKVIPLLSSHNLRVAAIEGAVYGTALLLIVAAKTKILRNMSTPAP